MFTALRCHQHRSNGRPSLQKAPNLASPKPYLVLKTSAEALLRHTYIWKQLLPSDILSGADFDFNKLDYILACESISLSTPRPRPLLLTSIPML